MAAAEEIHNRLVEIYKLSLTASAMAAAGEKDKASKLFDQAVAEAEAFNDPASTAFRLSQMAGLLDTTGERDRASKLFDRAVAVAEKITKKSKSNVLSHIADTLTNRLKQNSLTLSDVCI